MSGRRGSEAEPPPPEPGWIRFFHGDAQGLEDRRHDGNWLTSHQRADLLEGDAQFKHEVRAWLAPAGNVWAVLVTVDPSAKAVEKILEERYPETGGVLYWITLRFSGGAIASREEFTLTLVLQWGRAMRHLAVHLGLGDPPTIRRTRKELEWLQTHAEPVVMDRSVSFRAAPTKAMPMARLWELLAPGGDRHTNLKGVEARVDELSDDERGSLALTVEKQLLRWHAKVDADTGVHCATDSEGMHAMSLLLGGRAVWNRALRSPSEHMDDFPVDPGDVEAVLHFIRDVGAG